MSRRYGRTQRRRARDEQARLSAELHKVSGTLAYTTKTAIERGQRMHALTCEIQAAKDLLPNNTALFPPEAMADGGERRDRVYLSPAPLYEVSVSDGGAKHNLRRFEHVALDVLLTDVVVDQVKRQLHARVQFAGLDLFYAISPEALAAMPDDRLKDRLAAELARQLAPALVRRLRASR